MTSITVNFSDKFVSLSQIQKGEAFTVESSSTWPVF